MRAGIRGQFPAYDDAQVEAEAAHRIVRVRQVEEFGIYLPMPRE